MGRRRLTRQTLVSTLAKVEGVDYREARSRVSRAYDKLRDPVFVVIVDHKGVRGVVPDDEPTLF
jgi:hypothetical protein